MSGLPPASGAAPLRAAVEARQSALAARRDAGAPPAELAALHREVVYAALDSGDVAVAMTHALACLDLARAAGDPSLQAKAQVALALVQAEAYDDLGAAVHFQQADRLAREAGDDRGVALVAVNASHHELERRQYGAALTRLHELQASPQARGLDLGDSREMRQAFAINYVTSAAEALRAGEVPGPARAGVEAQLLAAVAELRGWNADRAALTQPLHVLSILDALTRHAVWARDLPAARRLADEHVGLAGQTGSLLLLGRALLERSRLAAHAGRWPEAIRDAEQAVRHFEAGGQDLWAARGREALAEAYARTGRFQDAFEAQQEVTRRVEDLFRAYHQQRALVHQIEQQAREAEVRAAALAEAALKDPLTGAPNRTHAMRVLEGLRVRPGQGSAVALMDLDHFKRVNDTYGHGVGDTVLRRVTRDLTAALRQVDCLARFGGEEFVVILSGVSLSEALACCERLRSVLADLDWADVAPGLRTTASFGVAPLDPDTGLDLTLQAADEALYAAKATGRNAVRVAEHRSPGRRPRTVPQPPRGGEGPGSPGQG
ncbi:GGDEF domain-containing protein [Deinococcus apachensis]|uniref:GGDEF domain-containing protein n=1 Tax=Deinococcus apachensis TaxID=309886 RepID=UPI00036225F3|nr:tetratricopeptide repeat-containing diguanylate cyclase [Deinococcus apachensis]